MKGNLKSVFIIFYFNKIQSSFIELKLEKEKMQRNLSGNFHLDQVESAHKDTVIASLKK